MDLNALRNAAPLLSLHGHQAEADAVNEAIAALQPGGEREELAQWCVNKANMSRLDDADAKNFRSVAALLRAPVAVTVTWRPIKTAPKGGSYFIATDKDVEGRTCVMRWCQNDKQFDPWGAKGPVMGMTHWAPLLLGPRALSAALAGEVK